MRQWRQRNRNQKKSDEQEVKEENRSEKENENTNNIVSDGDSTVKEGEKEEIKEEKDSSQENELNELVKPSEDIDIIDNTECKFNVNSFKLVYVVNSESYLYKRMALKRAKEVSRFRYFDLLSVGLDRHENF